MHIAQQYKIKGCKLLLLKVGALCAIRAELYTMCICNCA